MGNVNDSTSKSSEILTESLLKPETYIIPNSVRQPMVYKDQDVVKKIILATRGNLEGMVTTQTLNAHEQLCIQRTLERSRYRGKGFLCKFCDVSVLGYTIQKFIGEGVTGMVYEAVHQESGKIVVIKFIPLETEGKHSICFSVAPNVYRNEVRLNVFLSKQKLVPYVYGTGMTQGIYTHFKDVRRQKRTINIGYIVSEKWDLTLREYMLNYPQQFEANEGLIDEMIRKVGQQYLDFGLYHEDLHSRNIVLKVNANGDPADLVFIDVADVKDISLDNMVSFAKEPI